MLIIHLWEDWKGKFIEELAEYSWKYMTDIRVY
jgi:hypothetical protein